MPQVDDNRNTCTTIIPSSCIPYTGYVSDTIAALLPCRPNVNDIIYQQQVLIDTLKTSLGDLSVVDKLCFASIPTTQAGKNQLFITELCTIKTQLSNIEVIDPNQILVAINLLCLEDTACTPKITYTLVEILNKLVTSYCNLLTRVTTIETVLNI